MHRRISMTMRLAACAAALLLTACKCDGGEGCAEPCDRPSRQTVVFYDQSASSVADSTTRALFRNALNSTLASGLECEGDAVHGIPVHVHTRAKGDSVQVVSNVRDPDTLEVPKIRKAQEIQRHKRQMDTLLAQGRVRLTSFVDASVQSEFRQHTDLLGTLEVISDIVAQADSGSSVRVIYLGDMRESMPGTRDFDTRPPSTRAEAEAWADADKATLLRTMKVDTAHFDRVEVRVLLGNLATKRGAPEIRHYWERLFENVGIAKVQF